MKSRKTLNLIFSKTNFGPTGVYVLSSISRTLHNFSTGFFSIYRGILELKYDTRISRKNGSFANKTCCALIALFVKTKIYFCRGKFENKQINENSQYGFFIWTIVIYPKIFRKMFAVLKMKPQINEHLLKMSLYNMKNC